MSKKILFGFHAVGVRLKVAPTSIEAIYADPSRRDARMRQFVARVKEAGVRLIEAPSAHDPARWYGGAPGCRCPSHAD
jgi:tRNA G18 (ribose-2'-O)-methylase SpoU